MLLTARSGVKTCIVGVLLLMAPQADLLGRLQLGFEVQELMRARGQIGREPSSKLLLPEQLAESALLE